jgi:uncharacterized cupredoxin-like copper-binding protein
MPFAAFRRVCFTLGAVVVVVVAGCGHGNSGPRSANVVKISERDFRIASPRRIEAGDVLLSVRNQGPDAHELIVIRADAALPLRADGTTVDEEALEPSTVGVLEPGDPNSVRLLSVHLSPGHYELICNMAGHYLGGMNAELIVEQ